MVMTRDDCARLDAADPLADRRALFDLPPDCIYLDGNSLGPLTHASRRRLDDVVGRQWRRDLISSWNSHDWISMPLRVGDAIARLIGAAPGQVICTDSTSVNVFKLLAASLELRSDRRVILSASENFPTDLYMAQGLRDLVGQANCELKVVPPARIAEAIDDETAVVMLTEVDFRTGYRFDMRAITLAAHQRGALVLWDLAHSAGAMPVALDEVGADFAVGCGYKFLNGGPGAPAFLYIAKRHQDRARQPLSGWMGHARPFDFSPDYAPADGIARFASGSPGIIGMAALEGALTAFEGVDMQVVRDKSVALSNLFIELVQNDPQLADMRLATPVETGQRGSQVSFMHEDGYAIIQALIAEGVIGDFREPDILRFGITPLYTRFVDIFDAVASMHRVVAEGRHQSPAFHERGRVT